MWIKQLRGSLWSATAYLCCGDQDFPAPCPDTCLSVSGLRLEEMLLSPSWCPPSHKASPSTWARKGLHMQARAKEEQTWKYVAVLKSAEPMEFTPEHLWTTQGEFSSISAYICKASRGLGQASRGRRKEQSPSFNMEKKRPQELSTSLPNSISWKDSGTNY